MVLMLASGGGCLALVLSLGVVTLVVVTHDLEIAKCAAEEIQLEDGRLK